MAALMTEQTNITPVARAKIFDLLRDTEMETASPVPPKYVDASVADAMISRAMSSFSAPALAPETRATAQLSMEVLRNSMNAEMPQMLQARASG